MSTRNQNVKKPEATFNSSHRRDYVEKLEAVCVSAGSLGWGDFKSSPKHLNSVATSWLRAVVVPAAGARSELSCRAVSKQGGGQYRLQ